MNIAVNIGNSSLRIALLSHGEPKTWRIPVQSETVFEELAAILTPYTGRIEQGIIGSVNPKLNEPVCRVLTDCCRTAPVFAQLPDGFLLDYSGYCGKLGIDRAICCEAAFLRTPPPFVVVDFGTATTVNVIDCKKRFAGGAILPGIRMALSALSSDTAQLPALSALSDAPLIGQSTEAGMLAGVVRGAALYLDSAISHIFRDLHMTGRVIITGGNAEAVLPYLQTPYRHDPDLILKGLQALLDRTI